MAANNQFGMMNDIAENTALINRFQQTLAQAAIDELTIRDFTCDNIEKNNGYRMNRIAEVAIVELKEYFGRLINILNLHNPFLFLGREIQNFSDAEFVVINLHTFFVAQLQACETYLPFQLIESVINCCAELKLLLTEIYVFLPF